MSIRPAHSWSRSAPAPTASRPSRWPRCCAQAEVAAVGATKRVSGRSTAEIAVGAGADMDRATGILTKMLTEASNPHREEYGDLRAIGSLVGVCDLGFEDAVDHIATDARRWAAGTFQDDVTVLVLVLQCDPPQTGGQAGDP